MYAWELRIELHRGVRRAVKAIANNLAKLLVSLMAVAIRAINACAIICNINLMI